MRKTLNVVLAVILAFAMITSMAYVVTPERTSEYQISLVSAKAVTVQDSTQGIRAYSDLVDTTKGFQVNEVINVAITAEIKNLEKPSTNSKYKSISGKDIEVVVGSPNIDFSVARLSSPTLLTHVWSGYTGTNVATIGYVMYAGDVLDYDKATNEISWTFRGVDIYDMGATAGTNLVSFNAEIKSGKILVPAIKLKDRDVSWSLGNYSYDTTYEAPEAVAYTMVLTGVTMDNAGAATGEFYAKILVSGAEKFQDEATYYVDYNGVAYDSVPTASQLDSLRSGQATPLEWLDYVEIDVDLLEIAGGYNVYRYDIPASAILSNIPIIYGGDYDDYAGSDDTSWVDGEIIARVQPQTWDFATTKSDKTTVDVAGGVKSMKAYDYYKDGTKSTTTLWTSKSDYPVTSVVYSANKAYYAPGYYGGKITGGKAGNDKYYSSRPITGTPGLGAGTATQKVTVVDYFYADLPKSVVSGSNVMSKIQVWKGDQLVIGASDIAPVGTPTGTPTGDITASELGILASPNSSIDSDYYATFYSNGNGVYNVAQGGASTPVGGKFNDRLTEKVEYETDWIESPLGNNYYRVIVRPLDANVSHTYPLEQSPTGNQWVVFWFDPGNESKVAVPVSNVLNLYDPTQTTYDQSTAKDWKQGNAFMVPGVYDSTATSISSSSMYRNGWSGVAPPMVVSGTGYNGLDYALNATAWDTTANSAYTQPLRDLTALTNFLKNTMYSWPVFTEVHKQIDAPLGSGQKPVVTYGVLYDAAGQGTTSTSDLFPLEYDSQVVQIYFYDDLDNATRQNTQFQSDNVRYLDGWTPGVTPGTPTGYTYEDNVWFGNAAYGSIVFTEYYVTVDAEGRSYISLGGAYKYTGIATPSTSANWTYVDSYNKLYNNAYIVVAMNKGNVTGGYGFDGSYAAPVSMWDISANAEANWDIKYHNGIVVYTITANSSDRPWISMATENTEFDSDDGYGIALFDGYNANELAHRIYRSNDSNLSYSDASVGGHVNESASMIAAQKYFGLDTSYGTTFQVKDSVFEDKGAAAVYSENVTGTFKYGDLIIIGETVEEPTEEEEIVDEEPIDEEPIDEEPIDDEPIDDEPIDEEPAPVAPATGDGSANVAIALAAAAIVAAAGLAFVMKKVR